MSRVKFKVRTTKAELVYSTNSIRNPPKKK